MARSLTLKAYIVDITVVNTLEYIWVVAIDTQNDIC